MKEFKIPATALEDLIRAGQRRLFNAKTVILQDDGFCYKLLTQRQTGEIELAARITHPNPIQQTPTKPG